MDPTMQANLNPMLVASGRSWATKLVLILVLVATIFNRLNELVASDAIWPGVRRIKLINQTEPRSENLVEILGIKSCGQFTASKHNVVRNRYVGGMPASLKAFPSFVKLEFRSPGGSWMCGGVLISNHLILTASRCAQSATTAIRVLAGLVTNKGEEARNYEDPKENAQRRFIEGWCSIGKIPYGRDNKNVDDIAVLRTYKPFVFTDYVQPACIDLNLVTMNNLKYVGTGMAWERFDDFRDLSYINMQRNYECDESEVHSCFKSEQNGKLGGPCLDDNGSPLYTIMTVNSTSKQFVVGLSSYSSDMSEVCNVDPMRKYQFTDFNKVKNKLRNLIQNCAKSRQT